MPLPCLCTYRLPQTHCNTLPGSDLKIAQDWPPVPQLGLKIAPKLLSYCHITLDIHARLWYTKSGRGAERGTVREDALLFAGISEACSVLSPRHLRPSVNRLPYFLFTL